MKPVVKDKQLVKKGTLVGCSAGHLFFFDIYLACRLTVLFSIMLGALRGWPEETHSSGTPSLCHPWDWGRGRVRWSPPCGTELSVSVNSCLSWWPLLSVAPSGLGLVTRIPPQLMVSLYSACTLGNRSFIDLFRLPSLRVPFISCYDSGLKHQTIFTSSKCENWLLSTRKPVK